MRGWLLIWLFGLGLLPVGAQSLDALDAENGFMGMTFGQPLEGKRMVLIGKFLKKPMLYSPDDKLELSGIPLEYIRYYTWKNKLHSVQIRVLGETNANKLLELMEVFYGPGVQDGMAAHYTWPGKQVTLIYEKNLLTKNATVTVESRPMQIEFERDMGARIREY